MSFGKKILYGIGAIWCLPTTLLGFIIVAFAASTLGWHPDIPALVATPDAHSWLARLMSRRGIGGFSIGNVFVVFDPWYLKEPLLWKHEVECIRNQMMLGPIALAYNLLAVIIFF